jgi:hypothetical protein
MGFVFVLRLRRYTDIPVSEKYPDIHEGRTVYISFPSEDDNTTHLRNVMVFIFNEFQIILRTLMWRCVRFFASPSNTSTVDVKFLFYLPH